MWIVRGCAFAAFLVCAAALTSRVLPHVWHTSPGVSNNRLSFPLTYWNALGILAAIGLILAVGLATSDREIRLSRAVAAASVPVFATTLYFTFSRTAILVAVVCVLVYLAVAQQRAIVAGTLAILPPTVIALIVAYGADELATKHPATARGVSQGKDVALAVALCAIAAGVLRIALVPLDKRLSRVRFPAARKRQILAGTSGLAVVVVAIALAAGGASWVGDQYDKFVKGAATSEKDLRQRLLDPSNNGRTNHWNAAFDGFSEQPLHGTGAGTYEFTWDRHRDITVTVVDAHGLYFEVLSELGIVGLVLLVAVIVAILVGFARRARGLNRGYYAALLAAGLAWAIHAGMDWDWEMPAVTAWFFAAGGAALASRHRTRAKEEGSALANGNRIAFAAAMLVTAVTPALLMLSQADLSTAASDFDRGDCPGATKAAVASLDYVALRPQPYQMLGYCNLADGRITQAVAAMRKAVEQEPKGWEYHFGLAAALAEAGRDGRAELATAERLNPREPVIAAAKPAFTTARTPAEWERAGGAARRDILSSGILTLK